MKRSGELAGGLDVGFALDVGEAVKRSGEFSGDFDWRVDIDSEKEEGSRGGRSGNFGILMGSKIVGDWGRELTLFFSRGFSMIVELEEEEEKREEPKSISLPLVRVFPVAWS